MVEAPNPGEQRPSPKSTVVILVHGIRTQAWWQKSVAPMIEEATGATVIPIKYGYFDLVKFLCPFGICRNPPIEKLRKQIDGVRQQYKDSRLVVFAHSYGTYALARILLENPYFSFARIVLCGSIISEKFDWSRVEGQILSSNKRDAIINECGIKDVWPVIARSASWGYGATGTFGFGAFNVRDRFHPITHSGFFETDFVRKYWIPAISGERIEFTPTDRSTETTPPWFAIFRFPIRWLLVAAVTLAVFSGPTAVISPLFQKKAELSTSGPQSPIVKDVKGNVNIEFGNSPERQK